MSNFEKNLEVDIVNYDLGDVIKNLRQTYPPFIDVFILPNKWYNVKELCKSDSYLYIFALISKENPSITGFRWKFKVGDVILESPIINRSAEPIIVEGETVGYRFLMHPGGDMYVTDFKIEMPMGASLVIAFG